jgi:hypothetical protein
MEPLKPEMIFFIQHHTQPVLDQDRGTRANPSVGVQARELLADQMSLMEQLAVGSVEAVQPKLDSASK